MNKSYYTGNRIYFRPIDRTDSEIIVAWRNDPDNWRTLGKINPLNCIREDEYIDALYKSGGDVVFCITLRDGDQDIGMVGLHAIKPIDRSATYGILIGDKTQQGQGYGIEATQLMVQYGFEELNLNRIALCVFAEHDLGIHVYRQAGFVEEGRMREAFFRGGKYHDVIHMAVLRREWAKQDKA